MICIDKGHIHPAVIVEEAVHVFNITVTERLFGLMKSKAASYFGMGW